MRLQFLMVGWFGFPLDAERLMQRTLRFFGVQRPKGAHLRDAFEPIRLGNPKIATNLSRKMVVDFRVSWDRATSPGDCVVPP